MNWKLADAKNKFSEVFSRARAEGPQRVSRRGEEVVVIAAEEYEELKGERPTFIEYLLSGPSFEGVDLSRDKSPMRDADL